METRVSNEQTNKLTHDAGKNNSPTSTLQMGGEQLIEIFFNVVIPTIFIDITCL